MNKKALILALLAAIGMAGSQPVDARRGTEQGSQGAREDWQSGEVKSLREIEGMVLPRMRGMEYLGPEYDPQAQVYRLKFIQGKRVIFVDVDARNGNVLRQR